MTVSTRTVDAGNLVGKTTDERAARPPETLRVPAPGKAPGPFFPPAVKIALRELRAGTNGFGVFIACIALGVAVITTVGTLGDALRNSFEKQGETLLGGDVTLARPHQKAAAAERAWLDTKGRVSETATVRAMIRSTAPDSDEQTLAEVKAIDTAYPLAGSVTLSNGVNIADIAQGKGVAVEPILLERLRLKIGDQVSLGSGRLPILATIAAEPDKIVDRVTVGPRVFISTASLEKTGLADPGSLVSWRYALKLSGANAASDVRETRGLVRFRDEAKSGLPEGGFTVRDRRDPAPSVTRTLERLRQFLTLLGLTALLVGGVGVANAVATYIDKRRSVIATLKSLGATSSTIFTLHLTQVLTLATIGVLIGLVAGVAVPLIIGQMFGASLPIRTDVVIRPGTLALAAAYGYLVALLFTLWPLGKAELVRPTVLFRDEVAGENVRPRTPLLIGIIGIAIALFALAVLGADAKRLAAYYCLAVTGVLLIFWGLGWAVQWAAGKVPRPRRPEIALALGNISARDGLTRAVVLSLGAGLSLLVAVALVDRSIVAELQDRVPKTSPAYFVLDLKRGDIDGFTAAVKAKVPTAEVQTAPMLRGRIVAVNGVSGDLIKARPEAAWALNGDRGLSYSDVVPEGSTLKSGTWWAADYAGEPLVSLETGIARGLGVKIGETITVNVLGRNVIARVANLRDVKWESLAINFVLVFSPNTLRSAPHNVLATITLPDGTPLSQEADIARAVGKAYPSATAVRVKDAINQFNTIFTRIMTAIRAAGSITLLAGALVLAGALATAQRRRIKQAVILKVLGATRRRILTSHMVEYALLAFATAFIAVGVGALAAWITVSRVMDLTFVFSPRAVIEALGLALGMICLFGGYGTWRVLQARPVPHLRGT